MKHLTTVTIILACSIFTYAQAEQGNGETWECTGFSIASMINEQPMTIEATSDLSRASGTVSVNGLKYSSEYELRGFVRIWRIKHEKSVKSMDIFLIAPDYTGVLFLNVQPDDFEKNSEEQPSITVMCKQR